MMQFLYHPGFEYLLLAVSRRRQTNSGTSYVVFAVVALVALLVAATFYLIRYQRSRPIDNAKTIFRELCRAHQLTNAQCKLVWRLATGLKMPHPSMLFLNSALWQIPEDTPGQKGLSKKEWDQLLHIQKMLFLAPPVAR